MIGVLSLNPCLDQTITIDQLTPGGTHRVLDTRSDCGGKGINVAVALCQLGQAVQVLGFEFEGGQIAGFLSGHGIAYSPVAVPGGLRVNTKVFERQTGRMSEMNQTGTPVSPALVQQLRENILAVLDTLKVLVLTGSIPPGVPTDFYADIITAARAKDVCTVLDAQGALLMRGIAAGADVIKPNLQELSQSFDTPIDTREDAVRLAHQIALGGVGMVCVSMGAQGAVLVGHEQAYFAPGVPVAVRGVQGAGDAMVAGMCIALKNGESMQQVLRSGAVAATATLLREGTQMCRLQDVQAVQGDVRVLPLDLPVG